MSVPSMGCVLLSVVVGVVVVSRVCRLRPHSQGYAHSD
ncbi:hypothetical protein [Propionibacterium phage pa615]|nr:hypothetical protein [Propionibacterium phage pa615]